MITKATEIDNEISKTVPEDILASKAIPEHSQNSVDNSTPRVQLEDFDMLNGVQFKDLLERYFKKQGYAVNRISPRINSIDFLIEKDNVITAVATKHTFDLIQRSYVNKVIESTKMHGEASATMIITTSYFMPQARQLANECGIVLWDREKLKIQLGGLK